MNGFLAAIFWTSAFVSPHGSIFDDVSAKPSGEFRTLSFSTLEYQKQIVGSELQVDLAHGFSNGPLQRISSLSVTDDLGIWFGHGFYNEISLFEKSSLGLSFVPGLYYQADEVDLGGWIMFRSGVQLNYELQDNFFISICFDHRSSGDIWKYNPGLESWQIKFRTYI